MQLNKKVILIISFVILIGITTISVKVVETKKNDGNDIEKKDADIENIQVNTAEIIYCDNNILVFKDYYGLFVYSFDNKQLIDSLDMKYIGCDKNEGDNVCQFDTFNSGKIIKLFNEDTNYYLDWEKNKLYDSYDESKLNKDSESDILSFYNEETKMSAYSYNYAKNNEEMIYLSCSNGEAANVMVIIEKNGEIERMENIF